MRERASLLQEIDEQKSTERAAAKHQAIVSGFRPSVQRRAVEKVQSVAAAYDRRALGPAQLKAFDGNDMDPRYFSECFFRTFGTRLTLEEV